MPARNEAGRAVYSRIVPVDVTCYAVPGWGSGELWTQGGVVLAHDFTFDPSRGGSARDGRPTPSPGRSVLHREQVDLVERFAAFLTGEPVQFEDVELELEWATPLQGALVRTLRAVPRGEVVTYGELAALAGAPGAARAAGSFCATNRFAFVVPCHRVVAAHGIGGYGAAGIEVKRRLLALEGVRL